MAFAPLPNPIMVFDIETMPDLVTAKRLYPDLVALDDKDTITALQAIRREEAGNEFMRLPLHEVACLSFLWVENGNFILKTLSQETMSEAEILATFMRAFAKNPTLVSWNGAGFDLPVLLYRLTHHGMDGSSLIGHGKSQYLGKYAGKHLDLMEKFSFESYGNKHKLDVLASLCGLAGKGGTEGSQVVSMVQDKQWQELQTYCESDVMNTWFVYLRYLLLTGQSPALVDNLTTQSKNFLATQLNDDGTVRHQAFL